MLPEAFTRRLFEVAYDRLGKWLIWMGCIFEDLRVHWYHLFVSIRYHRKTQIAIRNIVQIIHLFFGQKGERHLAALTGKKDLCYNDTVRRTGRGTENGIKAFIGRLGVTSVTLSIFASSSKGITSIQIVQK